MSTTSMYLRRIFGLIVISLLTLISSCSKPEPDLRVGTNIWPGYGSLYFAEHIGAYGDHPIQIVPLPSATETIDGLRSGTLQAAALTIDEALTVLQDGIDIRLVSVLDTSSGADAILGKPSIDTADKLRGKRIGYEHTAVGAIMLNALIKQSNLSLGELHLEEITVDEHLLAFSSGRVDAVVTFEPIRSQLLALGAIVLFDSTSVPNQIVDVLVVTESAYQSNPRAIKALIKGHFDALAYQANYPAQAHQYMSELLGVPVSQLPAIYEGLHIPDLKENYALLSGTPSQLEETAYKLMALLLKDNLLKRKIDLTGVIDNSLLPAYTGAE